MFPQQKISLQYKVWDSHKLKSHEISFCIVITHWSSANTSNTVTSPESRVLSNHRLLDCLVTIDYFTVPLHPANCMQFPAVKAVQKDCQLPLETVEILTGHLSP